MRRINVEIFPGERPWRTRGIGLLAAAAVALGQLACMTGPKPFLQPKPLPGPAMGPAPMAQAGKAVPTAALVDWWSMLADPELDRLVGKAAAQDLHLQVAGEARDEAMVSLLAEVAQDYLRLRALQRRSDLTIDILVVQQEILGLARSLHGQGLNSDQDILQAEDQVARTRAQMVPLRAGIDQTEQALAILLSEEPRALARELDKGSAVPNVPPVAGMALPSVLLRRRPDVRGAERLIGSTDPRAGAAMAQRYPEFSLTGQFGSDSARFAAAFGGAAKQDPEDPRQALLAYQDAILAALREVEDAWAACRAEQELGTSLQRTVDAARQAVETSRQQYQQGVIDYLQMLDTQRQLLASQDNLTQSQQLAASRLVALYKALGGGWSWDPNHGAHGDAAS
jgi:outer membrane protein TolC